MTDLELNWTCDPFPRLNNTTLYKILQLRSEVFVVEQNCVYQDMDDRDFQSFHLCGWHQNNLAAYARLLPPGLSYSPEASIGRVITSPAFRGQAIGKQLMHKAIREVLTLFGQGDICISAQHHLKKFYEAFHFEQISEVYLEDNIPHITMKRSL